MLDALHAHRGEECSVDFPHLIGVSGRQRRDHRFAGTDPFGQVAQDDFRVLSIFGAADGDQGAGWPPASSIRLLAFPAPVIFRGFPFNRVMPAILRFSLVVMISRHKTRSSCGGCNRSAPSSRGFYGLSLVNSPTARRRPDRGGWYE